MKQIVLEKEWGGHKAKTTLDVLGPGDELRPKAVDAGRASTLVALKIAAEATAAAAPDDDAPAPKAPRKRG